MEWLALSSKCKELIHFIVVRSLAPQQATGNALALLNFPKGTLFNGASWSIFKPCDFVLSEEGQWDCNEGRAMFLEYLQFWEWFDVSSVYSEIIKSGILLIGIGLFLVFAGFKIKGVLGAVVALLLGTVLFLYLKNILHFL